MTVQTRQVKNYPKMVSTVVAPGEDSQYITVPHSNLPKHDTLAAAWTFSELIPSSPN